MALFGITWGNAALKMSVGQTGYIYATADAALAAARTGIKIGCFNLPGVQVDDLCDDAEKTPSNEAVIETPDEPVAYVDSDGDATWYWSEAEIRRYEEAPHVE